MQICYSLFALLLASVLSRVASLSPKDIESLHRQQVIRNADDGGGGVAGGVVEGKNKNGDLKRLQTRRRRDM